MWQEVQMMKQLRDGAISRETFVLICYYLNAQNDTLNLHCPQSTTIERPSPVYKL